MTTMASQAERGEASTTQCDGSVLKCSCIIGDFNRANSLLSHPSVLLKCTCTTSEQPSTSKSATADKVINNQSNILGDQIFYVPCSKRTYKTISEISQNDFIVHNLFCLDSSAPMTTLTKEVVQMKFAKLFVDANVNRKKAE